MSPKAETPDAPTADGIADVESSSTINPPPKIETPNSGSGQNGVTEEIPLAPETAPDVLIPPDSEITNLGQPDSKMQDENLNQGHGIDEQRIAHITREAPSPPIQDQDTSNGIPEPELPPPNLGGIAEEDLTDIESKTTEKEPADKSIPEPPLDISSDCDSIAAQAAEKDPNEILHEWGQTDQENKIEEIASPVKNPNVMVVIYQ